jgi:hypothetical protein
MAGSWASVFRDLAAWLGSTASSHGMPPGVVPRVTWKTPVLTVAR